MTITSTKKAGKYFKSKMEFTTGPIELEGMIKRQENIHIIDVRRPEDFELGHLPGAISKCRSVDASFAGLSRGKVNIVYSYSAECHLAAAAAKEFAENGYPVMELDGGFEAWKEHNLPVEV